MESQNPHLSQTVWENPVDPFFHFAGRLISKSQSQNFRGQGQFFFNQISDPFRHDRSFTGAGPGNNQKRAAAMCDCLQLFFIGFEIRHLLYIEQFADQKADNR